jgi:uncharacterized protein involved in exopolysaccharide biosynthesis
LITALRLEALKLEAQEAAASNRGDQHPDVVKLRLQRKQIEREIETEAAAVIRRLEDEVTVAEAQLDAAISSVTSMTKNAETAARLSIGLRELERISAADKEIYERLLSRARLAEEEMLLARNAAFVFSPALIPETPSFPNRKLFMALGAAFGLAIGSAMAVYLHLRRSRRT